MNRPKGRAMTPKGEMSSSGSGPAIMMMPPHIRATFMPNPPPKPLPIPSRRRSKEAWYRYHVDKLGSENKKGVGLSGVATYMTQFERVQPSSATAKKAPALTATQFKRLKAEHKEKLNRERLEPLIEKYLADKKASRGECEGMNCYKTLFVGRLAYEVTERRLLREFETHGNIKDIKVIYHNSSDQSSEPEAAKKSRGYAFIEYEREEDMKRAYKFADAMRIDGRAIVVDVERGHTVPNFLPRRLGGGLGATRAADKPPGAMTPGRYDPNAIARRSLAPPLTALGLPPAAAMMGVGFSQQGPPPRGGGYDNRGPPPPGYRDGPPPYGGYDNRAPFGGDRYGGPPPTYSGPPPPVYGGGYDNRGPPPPRGLPPPPPFGRGRGSSDRMPTKRGRSPSPVQSRSRYRR